MMLFYLILVIFYSSSIAANQHFSSLGRERSHQCLAKREQSPIAASATQKLSPNRNNRYVSTERRNISVDIINMLVLHYTEMNQQQSIENWEKYDENVGVSCHYMIGENGGLFQIVHEADRAWHAGNSYWRGHTNINSYSIGIEHVNMGVSMIHQEGLIQVEGSEKYWFPFSEEQKQKSIEVCKALVEHYDIPYRNVVTHQAIAPHRKEDPGPLFFYDELAKNGVGLSPVMTYEKDPQKPRYFEREVSQGISISWMQDRLKVFGYKCPQTGKEDNATKDIIRAFQAQYRPKNISGELDLQTMIVLYNLQRDLKYYSTPSQYKQLPNGISPESAIKSVV